MLKDLSNLANAAPAEILIFVGVGLAAPPAVCARNWTKANYEYGRLMELHELRLVAAHHSHADKKLKIQHRLSQKC
jgi:hypothetical protein